jgi:hypothetical protein
VFQKSFALCDVGDGEALSASATLSDMDSDSDISAASSNYDIDHILPGGAHPSGRRTRSTGGGGARRHSARTPIRHRPAGGHTHGDSKVPENPKVGFFCLENKTYRLTIPRILIPRVVRNLKARLRPDADDQATAFPRLPTVGCKSLGEGAGQPLARLSFP